MANDLGGVLPTCAFGNRKTGVGMGGRTGNLPQALLAVAGGNLESADESKYPQTRENL